MKTIVKIAAAVTITVSTLMLAGCSTYQYRSEADYYTTSPRSAQDNLVVKRYYQSKYYTNGYCPNYNGVYVRKQYYSGW